MNDKVDINCVFVYWKNAKFSRKGDLCLFERFLYYIFDYVILFLANLSCDIIAKMASTILSLVLTQGIMWDTVDLIVTTSIRSTTPAQCVLC